MRLIVGSLKTEDALATTGLRKPLSIGLTAADVLLITGDLVGLTKDV